MPYCNKCRLYRGKWGESAVKLNFLDGKPQSDGVELRSEIGSIKMCQHPACFITKYTPNPSHRKRVIVRIAGQGQLNRDNNCCLFKNAWWRFWVRNP